METKFYPMVLTFNNDYDHYKKTGRTPFAIGNYGKLEFMDYDKTRLRFDIRLIRIKKMLQYCGEQDYNKIYSSTKMLLKRMIEKNEHELYQLYFKKKLQEVEDMHPDKVKNPKLQLNDFFVPGTDEDYINKIQSNFKDKEPKTIAALMETIKDRLVIEHGSNTLSREKFVKVLTGRENINIRKYFTTGGCTIVEKDPVFETVKNLL